MTHLKCLRTLVCGKTVSVFCLLFFFETHLDRGPVQPQRGVDLAEDESFGDAVPEGRPVRLAADPERPVVLCRPRLRPIRQQLLGVAVLPGHLESGKQTIRVIKDL